MQTNQTTAAAPDNEDFVHSLLCFLHDHGNLYLHRQVNVTDGFARHAGTVGEVQLAMRYCRHQEVERLRDIVILPQTEEPCDGITAFLAQATWWGCTEDGNNWRGRIVHPDVVLITCADDDGRLGSRGTGITRPGQGHRADSRQPCRASPGLPRCLGHPFCNQHAKSVSAGAAARHGHPHPGERGRRTGSLPLPPQILLAGRYLACHPGR